MKLGLLITTYNRPEYLKQCFDSLLRADLSKVDVIQVMDDASDLGTLKIIESFCNRTSSKFSTNFKRLGIKDSIYIGCEFLISDGCTHIINLDGDALVRNDFVDRLLELHQQFPHSFVSGFECTNINPDGSPRHRIIETGNGWKKRASAGGINLLFTAEMYRKHIEPILSKNDNWDYLATRQTGVYCCSPSVIQHIGIESSMGHSGTGKQEPDISHTFKPLALPDVTLIGADSNPERLHKAAQESMKDIHFGNVVLLNPDIRSKEAYSKFCIQELYKHVQTSHMLVIQWDGYVKNWEAWDYTWLQYDYIGAPWEWYTDGMQVGNGGFSLRSRRLMEIVATDPVFDRNYHPEDDRICRTYRKYLEEKYGIKFAPVEVARKFSIEGYKHWNKTHTTQFGFHGPQVKFNETTQDGLGKIAYMEQYFGIGDVIFSMQIARNLQKRGYKIVWPVLPDYVEQLNRAYPDITFMDVWLTHEKFMLNKELITRGSTFYVPIRWTYELMKVPMRECMRSKYQFMQMDWTTWTEAKYQRYPEREKELAKLMGIEPGQPFTLVNRIFRSDNKGQANIQLPENPGKVVEMKPMAEFSIFDWSWLIENATEIHTVSTSIIYLLELLELKAKSVYIYKRLPLEQNHENYDYILRKHKNKYKLV